MQVFVQRSREGDLPFGPLAGVVQQVANQLQHILPDTEFDPLLREVNVTAGMKPGGILVITTPRSREELDFGEFKVATADVTGLAEKAGLKRGIVNTGIIGVLAKALPIVPLPALLEAIEAEFKDSKGQENAEAARMAHAHTEAG